jgi:beta-glucosidase
MTALPSEHPASEHPALAAHAQRARDLVAQMSLEEKVHLMSGQTDLRALMVDAFVYRHYNRLPYPAGGNARLGVPPVKFCDGPRGVVSDHATCFPVSMQRGASFDPQLERRVGEAIGAEVRAVGGNYFGGVCINLLRHPAGGRAQETFGEDPYHVGRMGAALVAGVQSQNVIACVKHFALNNQENTRFKLNVTCDERTLREVYLPHFKACVDAGAGSVMSAYNQVRGAYLSQNHYLLTDILKAEWGFSGFVISDFVFGVHETVAAANAGLDIEMPNTNHFGKRLVEAVQQGKVSEGVVTEAAERIVGALLRFAQAPDPRDYPKTLVACPDHRALAREVAEKSMVLLKNERQALPFDPTTVRTLAVIGTLAQEDNIGDHASSQVHPRSVVTPLQGLRRLLGPSVRVRYLPGKRPDAARQLAATADAVVIVAGNRYNDEGEFMAPLPLLHAGGDRVSLRLKPEDVALIQAVAPVNPRTVVVLIGGGAFIMEEWKDAAPAILHAFYPGMEGGTALAHVLFGRVNPGGKLPFTIPTDEAHLPPFDRDATQVEYDMYHGYTKLEKEGHAPAFAFGYGLSYTTFQVSDARFVVDGDEVVARATVTNTGPRDGDEVVQFYVGFEHSAVERPRKLLRGFQRARVAAGGSTAIEIRCPIASLRWYNPERKAWELEAMEYQAYIGSSSRPEDLLPGVFTLSGDR